MITIAEAKIQDIDIIIQIARITWPSTYAAIISESQIEYMLENMYNKVELINQIENGFIFYISYQNEKANGFASFSCIDETSKIYKLHKIYVLPQFQGLGIGKNLINKILHESDLRGGLKLKLQVNRKNKAKLFYEQMGFSVIKEINVDIGNGFFMNDYLMSIDLSNKI